MASTLARNAVIATNSGARKRSRRAKAAVPLAQGEGEGARELRRREAIGVSASLGATLLGPKGDASASTVVSKFWEQVDLPLSENVILLDLAFVPDEPDRGFITGTKQTLLETKDGGKTWEPQGIPIESDEEPNYRLQSVSFAGSEGYVVGKPGILLRSADKGESWERVPLSPRLPGSPLRITSLEGRGKAELVTDQGAIYTTEDGGQNWKAAVEEFPSATLNRTVSSGISGASYFSGTFTFVDRNDQGAYVATASRGNFYMTWEPGQSYWRPHNRPTSRRIQKIGWIPGGGLWELSQGGNLYFSREASIPQNDYDFLEKRIGSRGFGLLDIAFKNSTEAWAAGGSGNLFRSTDGGATWKRDKPVDKVPANLYSVAFFDDKGFVLGNNNVLLRYIA